jgi:hypothetical protein
VREVDDNQRRVEQLDSDRRIQAEAVQRIDNDRRVGEVDDNQRRVEQLDSDRRIQAEAVQRIDNDRRVREVDDAVARSRPPTRPRSTPVAAHELGRLTSYEVTNSPAARPGVTVLQIGPSWMEGARGPYRWIRILEDGVEKDSYREIRSAKQGWVMRGADRKGRGDVGEDVSWRQAVEAEKSFENVLEPRWYKTGPDGFDGLMFRFNPDGTVTVVVREDKNVARNVPYETITAVNENLIANLRKLRRAVHASWRSMGFSETQSRQVEATLDRLTNPRRKTRPGSLELEIMLGPKARLGAPSTAASSQRRVVDRLRNDLRAKTGIDVPIRRTRMEGRYAREVAEERERAALRKDSSGKETSTTRAEAELAMSARVRGLAPGPLARGAAPGVFLSPNGRRIVTRLPDPPRGSVKMGGLARELLRTADDPALRRRHSPAPIVVVDTSRFTEQQVRQLARALKAEAKEHAVPVSRIRIGNSETGFLQTVPEVLAR